MRTTSHLFPSFVRKSIGAGALALLMTACGTMQETVQVRDDVYDIPDRTVVASVDPVPETAPPSSNDDYYNADQAAQYQQGSYYDRTYNDPAWYNRDRFGFGYNSSPWGSSWNMSYGMGWGNNTWYNSPTGMYNPYWGNSWQSGYGYYSPWNGGMYDPWNSGWGGGYGCGYNWGWNSPYGWGNNWGYGYNPYGYGGYGGYGYYGGYGGYGGYGWQGGDYGVTPIRAHRPSITGGGGGTNMQSNPRSARSNNIGLMRPTTTRQPARTERPVQFDTTRPAVTRERNDQGQQPVQKERKEHKERPVRTRERNPDPSPSFDRGGGGGGGGSRGGGGGGGGNSPSPRPRR